MCITALLLWIEKILTLFSSTEWISVHSWINYQFPGLDAWWKHPASPRQQARCNFSKPAQLLLLGALLWSAYKRLRALRAVCVSMALPSFLGPDGRCPQPESLPEQRRWLTGICDREVRASSADAHAALSLTSLTRRHLNYKFLMSAGRQHGKFDCVDDGLTCDDVDRLCRIKQTIKNHPRSCQRSSSLPGV